MARGPALLPGGVPHAFLSLWDKRQDDWSEVYALTAIDEHSRALAQEDWEIWRRWQNAYHTGVVPSSSGPALEEERPRHLELNKHLAPLLSTSSRATVFAEAIFQPRLRVDPRPTEPHDLEVQWRVTTRRPDLGKV